MNLENLKPLLFSRLISLLDGQLPPQGIIAGPGIASILLSILWDRDIPIENIDLYTDWPYESEEYLDHLISSKPSLSDEIYPPIVQNGISIRSSVSAGILTRHIIEKQQPVFGKDRTLLILHALELNAFGVGYDCYSHNLHVTSEFEEFYTSRQLRIQSPVYAENLFLLPKFRNVFDCYADIGEEIGLLTSFRRLCTLNGDCGAYTNLVSTESAQIFYLFRHEFEPLCTVSSESEQPIIPGLEGPLGIKYRLSFRNAFDRPLGYPDIYRLLKSTEVNFDSYVHAVIYTHCVRKSTSSTLRRRFICALSRPITTCMVLLNPACLDYDFSDRHVLAIDDFYKAHPSCVRILLGLNLTVLALTAAIQEIRKFAKKNGNQIIGLIENHNRIGYSLREINKESLELLLVTYRNNAGTPLLESAANLDAFEYRDLVTELTTTTELECEGWRMKHCVGGYAPVMSSDQGNTRIFHIDGAHPSTAAIYFQGKFSELSYEVYGVANCDPVPEHVLITEHLGRYLTNTIWSGADQHQDGGSYAYV